MGFLAARTNAGLSQGKVARELGITDAAVSMWENGKTRPRAALLVKLAELYHCSVDELLTDNPCSPELERQIGTGQSGV